MNAKIGWVLVVVGLVAALLAALADTVGLGNVDGMGSKQIAVLVIGLLIAVIGVASVRRPA